jgi:hypothetical protein
MVFDEKTKTNRLSQEAYIPDEPQFDVIVNHTGASLRLSRVSLAPMALSVTPTLSTTTAMR